MTHSSPRDLCELDAVAIAALQQRVMALESEVLRLSRGYRQLKLLLAASSSPIPGVDRPSQTNLSNPPDLNGSVSLPLPSGDDFQTAAVPGLETLSEGSGSHFSSATLIGENVPGYTAGEPLEEDHPHVSPRRAFVKWVPTTVAELPTIEARCRLKAEASRWAEQRRRIIAAGGDFRTKIEPKDRDLIWQAKQLPDCFLWMSHPTGPNPSDPGRWLTLGDCFEVLANGISAVLRVMEHPDRQSEAFGKVVDLLAESQSALRVIISQMDGPPTDHDQARIFGWLKGMATDRQIFIRRYMRLDDPADPQEIGSLAQRLKNFEAEWEKTRLVELQRKKVLGEIRSRLAQITTEAENSSPSPTLVESVWSSVVQEIHQLVQEGLSPSHLELREILLEAIERLPEMAKAPSGFQMTIREIDRYLGSIAEPENFSSQETTVELSTHVLEVAHLLAGRAVLLIGGARHQ